MENVPFNKRSLNYLCKRMNWEIAEDDIRKTVELLSELKKKDPMFADSVLVDSDSKIQALMWTNGRSRYQYSTFGDAITFDTTYRTNQYDMPFGLFVGVNHHFQSIILGGVLMRNEKEETFDRVFKEFVSLMGGKATLTILTCTPLFMIAKSHSRLLSTLFLYRLTLILETDQCRSMELPIANVLPGTKHRWCKWHVLRRAKETLGPAYTMNKELRDELHKILEYMPTVKEFEAAWQTLVQKYNLQEHPMMNQLYELRKKWAKPYFAGVFCARMTSTQRSESTNHMLKNFVPPGASMHMFIKHYQKLQFDRDAEENFAEKKSRLVSPVLKSGLPLERHAGKVYTPALFKLFQEACFKSASYYVENILAVNDTYCVTHLYADQREAWSKTSYNVKVQQPDNYLQCECGMYEHMGLLCCHAIRVMAQLRFTKIPERHIMRRWTKEACEDLPEYLKIYKGRSPILGSTTFRHTALYTTALDIVRMGDSNPEAFEFAMSKLSDAMVGLKEKANGSDDKGLEDILDKEKIDMQQNINGKTVLKNSMIVESRKRDRGRPTNARCRPCRPGYEVSQPRTKFCKKCRGKGHNSAKSPANGGQTRSRGRNPGAVSAA
uniref:Protein FAR1-RELATED SEQUENCE n=1 Tax=Hordeum vulgare subsp. vulgare TaxID=112509 RepID=A0A8I6WQ28_HORVV